MKQFNLEEYLKNPDKKVVTRAGRKVTRFLCTDAKTDFPIVALIEATPDSTMECLHTFKKNGRHYGEENSPYDLFFAPEKHEGWINIYLSDTPYTDGNIYSSKEEAKESIYDSSGLLRSDYNGTIKIKWNY